VLKKYSATDLKKILGADDAVFWFRRDLRLDDNAGLYHALRSGKNVVCTFIFDTEILENLEDKNDSRVTFLHQSIGILRSELHEHGSSLLVFHGKPAELFQDIEVAEVFANEDYEPYARDRDESVSRILARKGIRLTTYKDQVIFSKDEVIKENGEPYTVFTPYSRKWKSLFSKFYVTPYSSKKYLSHLKKMSPLPFPSLRDIGFETGTVGFPERIIPMAIVKNYHHTRDYPSLHGTTRLSVHLRFGTVSIRRIVAKALSANETWLNELIWREFYQAILYHFPHVAHESFKPAYNRIEWRNNEAEFAAWTRGETGFPLVDAGMRELNQTGFMHNRVRMLAASFLVKHLLVDWRWGEAYFARKLLDFELASNNGGWQWAAGSGCDAAPYFRIFNPQLQQKKFDPDLTYCKRWIPELGTSQYPDPIVDHAMARKRAMSVYQKALQQP
jgi:deoxyribodipyrimidine photo-lyase